jgi:hypothetical protein
MSEIRRTAENFAMYVVQELPSEIEAIVLATFNPGSWFN